MLKFDPYPFQKLGIDHALNVLRNAGPPTLYAAPTGCGKSVIELKVQEALLADGGSNPWVVTPREEIAVGMLEKLGYPDADMLDHRIGTPVRLRNRLMDGRLRHPSHLIVDEGHHHSADTWQQLDLLSGLCPSVAYTATPYRGSPRSTKQLRDHWGDPVWLITYTEAAAEGYIKLPDFRMLPLVDDDVVLVSNGEFDVASVDAATVDRLSDLADHAKGWYNGRWDVPTVFAAPSTACAVRLAHELSTRGLPCVRIDAQTPKSARQPAFQATVERITALVHINIVTEGVDLPLRRLVDLAPTMSPVKWVQQLGRITRPTQETPQYICTNRNLLRHAYALDGAVPVAAVERAEKALPPSNRAHTRVLGMEAIGRFKPMHVKLLSGLRLSIYSLSTVVGSVVVEYCVLVHPTLDPVWATKVNTQVDGVKQYGSWRLCDPPENVVGFSSVGPKALSEKQMQWWSRAAARYGLDPEQEVTRKNFQALPVLADTGTRF